MLQFKLFILLIAISFNYKSNSKITTKKIDKNKMSEYTNYFVVKSSSENEVRAKLNAAKILSIVEADEKNYWFSTYKRNSAYNWVVVCTNEANFDRLKKLFKEVILFYQDENRIDWSIVLKTDNHSIIKKFQQRKVITFADSEKVVFEKCFSKKFNEMQSLLKPNKGADFLNFVGIPYMGLTDQENILSQLKPLNGKYSFLGSEMDD